MAKTLTLEKGNEFILDNIFPQQEDFNFIVDSKLDYDVNGKLADSNHLPWKIVAAIPNSDRDYHFVKLLLISILLPWDDLKNQLLINFKNESNKIFNLRYSFNKSELKQILSYAAEHSNLLSDSVAKAKERLNAAPKPEKKVIIPNIEVKSGMGQGPYRIIVYDYKYNPAARRHIIISKKVKGSDVYTVAVRGSSGAEWRNQPTFDTVEQAKAFIGEIAKGNMHSVTDISKFQYRITDKFTDTSMLEDRIRVNTTCGVASIGRNNKYLKESLTINAMINELEKMGKHYKFDKYTDQQIYRIYQWAKANENNKETNNTVINNLKYCDNCGSALTDGGKCPICDLGEDSMLNEKVEKHDELNPKLFNKDETLKDEVKEKVNLIVDEFLSGLKDDEIKIEVQDILLVGSNVNYNYTSKSDLDIHIVTDTEKLHCPDNLYPALYSAYRSLFNKKFDIDFYGIPVELYVETEGTPRVSSGLYSIKQDKWLKKPVMAEIPEINEEKFETELAKWEERYKKLVDKSEDKLEEAFWNKDKIDKEELENILNCKIDLNNENTDDKHMIFNLDAGKSIENTIAYLSKLGFDLRKIDRVDKLKNGASAIIYNDIPAKSQLRLAENKLNEVTLDYGREVSKLKDYEIYKKRNWGACSLDKLLYDYDIVLKGYYPYSRTAIENELRARGLHNHIKSNNSQQQSQQIQNNQSTINTVKQTNYIPELDKDSVSIDNLNNAKAYNDGDTTKINLTVGSDATLFFYLLIALALKLQKLKNDVLAVLSKEQVFRKGWTNEELKKALTHYLENKELMNKINNEVNKFNTQGKAMESLTEEIKTKQIEAINKFIEDIYNLRKTGLATPESEWSIDNLVFKEIRNRGYIDELKELKNQLKAKEMSLEK